LAGKTGIISLYTGAGGLDIGAQKAGFEIRLCVEINPVRVETLSLNNPSWQVVKDDVTRLSGSSILKRSGLRKSDTFFLSAASPCAPYSKSAFWVPNRLSHVKSDYRTPTLWHFVRLVREMRPEGFIFENVDGLLFEPCLPLFRRMINSLRRSGYGLSWRVVNAANFGVAQKRERVFVVGLKNGQAFNFPEPTHSPPNYVSAANAFRGLQDKEEDGETVTGKWAHLLSAIPPGKNYLHLTKARGRRKAIFRWRSRYWSFLLKLSPRLPSWTIQAHPGPYCGPFHWKNRRLRISELKRIQTFPDSYRLAGDRTSAWAQLGDATPPLVAAKLCAAMLKQAGLG
jgi:DNA (cytosine-5)-methyltransferase 1